MPTNNYLAVATGGGANVDSQATYAANPLLPVGNQPGVASSKFNNNALRQSSFFVAALAQLLCNITGDDVLDDANQTNLLATMKKLFTKSPTITKFTSGSGTYTVPAGVQWLRVRMVGGGAGGSHSMAGGGGAGGNTTFGTALLVANGAAGQAGGTTSLGAAIGTAVTGSYGSDAQAATAGGKGASSPFGDGAGGIVFGSGGTYQTPAPGAGGGGSNATGASNGGEGGGAGGYVDAIIAAPLNATYAYVVGAAGASGFTQGGAGGPGYIEIEEHYN